MIFNLLSNAPAQMPQMVGILIFCVGIALFFGIMKYFSWRIAK